MVLEKHFFFIFSIIFQYIFQYSFLILNLSIECLELSYCVFKKVLHLKKFHIKLEKDFVMKVHYFDMIVWKYIMQNMFWHTRSLYHIKLGFFMSLLLCKSTAKILANRYVFIIYENFHMR